MCYFYFVIKVINDSILNPVNNRIIAAITRNGPNGISCSGFLFIKNNEAGSAKKEDKNTAKTEVGHPNVIPNININFISPPPIDSLLNNKSPNSFKAYISKKAIIPSNKKDKASKNPNCKILIIVIEIPETINISSGIIIV